MNARELKPFVVFEYKDLTIEFLNKSLFDNKKCALIFEQDILGQMLSGKNISLILKRTLSFTSWKTLKFKTISKNLFSRVNSSFKVVINSKFLEIISETITNFCDIFKIKIPSIVSYSILKHQTHITVELETNRTHS